MEKILLLIPEDDFKPQMLDFVETIAIPGKSKIAGVFLSDNGLKNSPVLRSVGAQVFVDETNQTTEEFDQYQKDTQRNVRLFKDGCQQRGINAIVHKEEGNPLDTILKESRYADLIIAAPSLSYSGEKTVPTKFIKELLARAECPVLIAPDYFEQTDEVVFAYDGSKSSVFAIKQFCYQVPKLANKKVVILHITQPGLSRNEDPIEKALFKEWLNMKFSKYSFITIPGDSRDALFNYFIEHNDNNKLLVIGAFGRGLLSSFFWHSTAEKVLKVIDIPIFISHY